MTQNQTTTQVLEGSDLGGRSILVTGATAGLGLETARALAASGARVLLAARDAERLTAAVDTIRSGVPDADLDTIVLDLAELASVRRAAAHVAGLTDRLDALVNNAGVMFTPLDRTADGFELQFGVNHLGHFLLTRLLDPLLGAGSRVVTLTSAGHAIADIDLDDPGWERRDYDKFAAYGAAKTANILFTVELDRRLRDRGARAFAVHPGSVVTELARHMDRDDVARMVRLSSRPPTRPVGVEHGAATSVWAVTAPELDATDAPYLADCAPSTDVAPYAVDPDRAARLWQQSERLVGVAPATFADVLRARAGDHRTSLLFEDESWTWDEVVRESAERAAALAALLPRPEGRQVHVGVLLENVPDFVFWIGAAALAGAAVVGINSSRSGPEIAHDIRHADVDLVVTESRLAHLLEGFDHGIPRERVLDVDDPSYAAFLAPHRGAPLPDTVPSPDDIALLLFSSGSTGAPKAVVVGQGRLGRLVEALVERTRMRPDSVAYLCMPLFHGNAVMLNLATAMRVGATVALTRRFSASRFSPDVHRYGVTFVNYVGRALSYVLSRPEDPRDRAGTLELAFGTEASEADIARFSERFGCEVVEGYGLSEGVLRINRTPDTPPGSLGLPAGGVDVRILDEALGHECPRAEFDDSGRLLDQAAVGQIVAVGAARTFEGYYKNPGAMADRIRGDDFWTGDLGYRDADGFFYFAGRSSDWLRVDSENFAAAPVERVLQRFPGVLAAPVYAVPDPRTGDQVMCTLEMAPGVAFDPDAFGEFLAAQPEMGAKWWPRFVRVTDQLPLTGSNKVDKAPLRAAAWQTDDPVHMRVGRTREYVVLDAAVRTSVEEEFIAHGRAALLPVSGPQPVG